MYVYEIKLIWCIDIFLMIRLVMSKKIKNNKIIIINFSKTQLNYGPDRILKK